MTVRRQKPTYIQRKQKDTTNLKALIWTGSIIGAIVLVMTLLLILNR